VREEFVCIVVELEDFANMSSSGERRTMDLVK
jgi:hypothetical protein